MCRKNYTEKNIIPKYLVETEMNLVIFYKNKKNIDYAYLKISSIDVTTNICFEFEILMTLVKYRLFTRWFVSGI